MTMNTPTELEKIDGPSLKSIIARSLLAVAIAIPVTTVAGGVIQHVKTENAHAYTVQNWQHDTDNAIDSIVRWSEQAPADLAVLKQTIQAKREMMDMAVMDIGMSGRLLGFTKGPEARADAFAEMVGKVQSKIDELDASDWKPDPALATRSPRDREMDNWFVENAKTAHQNLMVIRTATIGSR